MSHHKSSSGRILLGIIFVLLGMVFIADNFYLFNFDFGYYIFQWETIVIVIGLIILANHPKSFGGYFMIALGGLSLLGDYYHFTVWEIFEDYWPVLLIILGVYIIYKRDNYKKEPQDEESCCFHGHDKKYFDVTEDFIDTTVIFSGKRMFVKSQNFSGGKTTTIFGGVEVDLTGAGLAPGKNVLDTFTLFGGTEIYVPKEWSLAVNVVSIFGGVDDKRNSLGAATQDQNSLVIKGLVLFGGVEVKYY